MKAFAASFDCSSGTCFPFVIWQKGGDKTTLLNVKTAGICEFDEIHSLNILHGEICDLVIYIYI